MTATRERARSRAELPTSIGCMYFLVAKRRTRHPAGGLQHSATGRTTRKQQLTAEARREPTRVPPHVARIQSIAEPRHPPSFLLLHSRHSALITVLLQMLLSTNVPDRRALRGHNQFAKWFIFSLESAQKCPRKRARLAKNAWSKYFPTLLARRR